MGNYIGASPFTGSPESVEVHGETTKIVKAGILTMEDELTSEYFCN